nr:DUF2577 family protein [Cohnella sp. WQ 127256]
MRLTKLFKERNNPPPVGAIIGEVISGFPNLSVSLGDEIILDDDQLIIGNYLYRMHYHLDDLHHTPVPITLSSGDQVIMVPTANKQVYFVIDKVGE